MNSDPISKKQVYTERYGEIPSQNQPQGDYDSFDVRGPQGAQNRGNLSPEDYVDIAGGEHAEFMSEEELFSGMNDEEYVAHYRNNVAPRNRQEAEALMAEMGRQEAPPYNAKQEISEVKKLLKKPENAVVFDEESMDAVQEKIRDLEKLANKANSDPEELQEKIEELKEDIQNAIDAGLASRKEQISLIKKEITSLSKKLDKARITSADKSALTRDLDSLKAKLKSPTVDLEAAVEELNDIKKDFKNAKPDWPLEAILGKIPEPNDWNKKAMAEDIVKNIERAFSTKDWQSVVDGLNANIGWHAELPADQGERNRKIKNDVIRKIVTGIFQAAGSMEECLELLKMIPADVRQQMIDLVSAETGELSEKHAGDQWSSGGTANILRQSLETGDLSAEED